MRTMTLNGKWHIKEYDGNVECPATAPGCVHTDLLAAGKIPDPFFSTNELQTQWISDRDWTYSRTFRIDGDPGPAKKRLLECEGLDTIAAVRINGKLAGATENMFRRYVFDISDMVIPGENSIEIRFSSPFKAGELKSLQIPYEVAGSEYHWPLGQERITHRNQLRKAQYQFGWDWGPCLPTAGIWRDICVIEPEHAYIEYVTTSQSFTSSGVTLSIQTYVDAVSSGAVILRGALKDSEGKVIGECAAKRLTLKSGKRKISLVMEVVNPARWYPNGYGGQPLHALELSIADDDGKMLDSKCVKIGFRDIKLVRERDKDDESFYFTVNGIPVFAKGANWLPADSFPSRITAEKYQFLLRSAADANMNMLRVWGGGLYESDLFYDLCDELGILVWQDFLFACCAYPATSEFLGNVKEEVTHQIRRLSSHACVALWCGNNENEGVWRWWSRNKKHEVLVKKDYRRLQNMLGHTCKLEDPSRPFTPASPFPGGKQNIGDEHFWGVGSKREPFSDYLKVKPRFVSEFGFQSFPNFRTVKDMAAPHNINPGSPEIEHHQRKSGWNALLIDYICANFRLPSSMEHICYLTQLNQALAMKTAVEHWRRSKPWTMGALYWQFNDCWPAISWSGIDYNLNWKALHHFARRFFAPLLASCVEEGANVQVWLTSDVIQPVDGNVLVELWRTDGSILDTFEKSFKLQKLGNKRIMTLKQEQLFTHGNTRENSILRVKAIGGGLSSENTHVFAPYKHLDLMEADINCSTHHAKREVILTTRKPALFVEVDAVDGGFVFPDNYVHLFPGTEVVLSYRPTTGGPQEPLTGKLKITPLAHTVNNQ